MVAGDGRINGAAEGRISDAADGRLIGTIGGQYMMSANWQAMGAGVNICWIRAVHYYI